MTRTTYMEIAGKKYPMRMSLGATIAISKRFGSVEKMADTLSGMTEADAVEAIVWLLELMIKQGCAYKNLFEKDLPVENHAPVVDGKYVALTSEEIEVAVTMYDLGSLKEKIFVTIAGGKMQDVREAENPNEVKKNETM